MHADVQETNFDRWIAIALAVGGTLMLIGAFSVRAHPFDMSPSMDGVLTCGLLGFLLAHYLESGSFSPHIWAGFVGGSFCFLGTSTLVIALVGDMLVRQRLNQEEVLYYLKRDLYRRAAPRPGAEPDAR